LRAEKLSHHNGSGQRILLATPCFPVISLGSV
jgi:hypothetical protein